MNINQFARLTTVFFASIISIAMGSLQGYPSYEEANFELSSLLSKYPQYLTRASIGQSYEGRDMYAYKVYAGHYELGSDGVQRVPSKIPKLLLTSLLHGNEPVTLTTSMFALRSILDIVSDKSIELPGISADIRYMLSTRELHVIPFLNPDAYAATTYEFLYRKNRRVTCSRDSRLGGVDLNRNFDIGWKHVDDICDVTYAGSQPFSEPETRAIRDYALANSFVSAMNLHAFGDMLTWPFNGDYPGMGLAPQHAQFYEQLQSVFSFSFSGPVHATPLNYSAFGEMNDWLYANLGVVSMSPELGTLEQGGFTPDQATAMEIAETNFHRILYWMYKAGGGEISWLQIHPQSFDERDQQRYVEIAVYNSGLIPAKVGGAHSVVTVRTNNGNSIVYRADLEMESHAISVPPGESANIRIPLIGSNLGIPADSIETVCIMHTVYNCRCFTMSDSNESRSYIDFGTISNPVSELCVFKEMIPTIPAVTKGEAILPQPSQEETSSAFPVFFIYGIVAGMIIYLLKFLWTHLPPRTRRVTDVRYTFKDLEIDSDFVPIGGTRAVETLE